MALITLADFNGGTIPTTTVNQWIAAIKQLQPLVIPIKALRITNTGAPIATTSAGTEMDLAKYQFTGLTLTTGRYYMLRYNITYTKTVAGDSFDFKVRVNTAVSGTQIGLTGFNPTRSSTGAEETLEFVFLGDSTYTSLYLSVIRSAGTGTLAYFGASGTLNRGWAELLDLGDSANWIDVA